MDDRLHVVARRVQADDDVAAAVGEPFEDRQQNVVLIVARAVRLDARAEVPRRADGRAVAGVRVEDRAGHGRQLVVGHHLDDRGDRFAPQAVAIAPNPSRRRPGSGGSASAGRPSAPRCRPATAHRSERSSASVTPSSTKRRARSRRAAAPRATGALRRRTRGIVGAADEQIAFLELVREDERLAQIQGRSIAPRQRLT